jgi:hypothetical protein
LSDSTITVDGWLTWPSGDKTRRLDNPVSSDYGPKSIYFDGTYGWEFNNCTYPFGRWLEVNTVLTDEEKVMLKLEYG